MPVTGATSPEFVAATTESPPQAQLIARPGAFVAPGRGHRRSPSRSNRCRRDALRRAGRSPATSIAFVGRRPGRRRARRSTRRRSPTVILRAPDGVVVATICAGRRRRLAGAADPARRPAGHLPRERRRSSATSPDRRRIRAGRARPDHPLARRCDDPAVAVVSGSSCWWTPARGAATRSTGDAGPAAAVQARRGNRRRGRLAMSDCDPASARIRASIIMEASCPAVIASCPLRRAVRIVPSCSSWSRAVPRRPRPVGVPAVVRRPTSGSAPSSRSTATPAAWPRRSSRASRSRPTSSTPTAGSAAGGSSSTCATWSAGDRRAGGHGHPQGGRRQRRRRRLLVGPVDPGQPGGERRRPRLLGGRRGRRPADRPRPAARVPGRRERHEPRVELGRLRRRPSSRRGSARRRRSLRIAIVVARTTTTPARSPTPRPRRRSAPGRRSSPARPTT